MKYRKQYIGKKNIGKKININRYVYINKIPPRAKLEDIFNHFKTIGNLNKENISMFANEDGTPRGDCIITYEDPVIAPYAKLHFDGKPFLEHMIKANLATKEQINFLKNISLLDHQKREREEIN